MTFNYNALNLLSVVKENNVVKASYRYLADRTKISVRNGNGNTGYYYEGSCVYAVVNNTSDIEAIWITESYRINNVDYLAKYICNGEYKWNSCNILNSRILCFYEY